MRTAPFLLLLSALAAAPSPVALAAPAGSAASARLAPAPAPVTAEALKAHVKGRAGQGKVVLVNAWATWCIPCRHEMPDLLKLRSELAGRGFELVLVTTDFDSEIPQAREFLGSLGVDFATWQKKQRDQEFIDGLDPSWSGALPFTALHDRQGRLVASWEGRESLEQMRARILPLLPPPGAAR